MEMNIEMKELEEKAIQLFGSVENAYKFNAIHKEEKRKLISSGQYIESQSRIAWDRAMSRFKQEVGY